MDYADGAFREKMNLLRTTTSQSISGTYLHSHDWIILSMIN